METSWRVDVAAALAALEVRPLTHVFLVACGGSLSVMLPGKVIMDRFAPDLPCDALNAEEFICRAPARLGPAALVILCSQTGSTKETVAAAHFARGKGAATIAMSLDIASPLAIAADYAVAYRAHYTTGEKIDAADSNYAVLYCLLAGLLAQRGQANLLAALRKSLAGLQPAIDRAKVALAEPLAAYAPRFANAPAVYTLGAGANFGAAYSFAICVLMEMQWINSQAIHANEFFHGPFEVVDKSACFIAMLGTGPSRRLEERARDFLLRYGDARNIMVLDAAGLDLDGLEEPFREFLAPLVFFDVLWGFAFRLADARSQPMLEARRYMKKIANY
ncbi:MAG TPA: SIS domain-containing protein [Beijerinckiaceae bacterium]|nr:SIS domain-containing protein [Beijerinckiaceae bacterium]